QTVEARKGHPRQSFGSAPSIGCHRDWQLAVKRRRRESNPLETALQAGGVAPCAPRQENFFFFFFFFVFWILKSKKETQKTKTKSRKPKMSMPSPGVDPGLRPSQSRVHPPHSEDKIRNPKSKIQNAYSPPRNRTSSCSFEGCRASGTLAGHIVSRPGLEPGP